MKNLKRVSFCMLAVMVMLMIAGCSSKDSDTDKNAEKAVSISVTFMNGEEKLGTISATAGKVIDAASYEKFQNIENFEWSGWFETPTYLEVSKKDLTKDTFSKDTTLYGYFKPTNLTEDTRKWYIVGESSDENSVLTAGKWAGPVEDDVKAKCELLPTNVNVNEFSITVDLHAGDKFQIIHDWQWEDQKGFGYVSEYDESQIENGGGLSAETNKSNICVLMDGNYTITLSTNPDDSAMDAIVIKKN